MASQIPAELPAIRLEQQVLLPSAYATVAVPSKRHSALLEHLSTAGKDVYVAVIPDAELSSHAQDAADSSTRGLTQDHVGSIATAARVLQISRIVKSGTWVLVLEGLCRIQIDEVIIAMDPEGDYDCVLITQLEGPGVISGSAGVSETTAGSSHSAAVSNQTSYNRSRELHQPVPQDNASHNATGGKAGNESESTVQDLGKQLRSTTRALLRQLTRHATGPAAAQVKRLSDLLLAVPAWQAADVVAAALSSSYQERLAVLRAVDHKQRMKLALTLAKTALEGLRSADPTAAGSGKAGLSSVLNLKSIRTGKGLQGDEAGWRDSLLGNGGSVDDDMDELDAIMTRLAAAKPPPEVAKAAAKEYKRLKQSGDQQPGAAAVRAYLETLADLPWSRTSADLARIQKAQQDQQQQQETAAAEGNSLAANDVQKVNQGSKATSHTNSGSVNSDHILAGAVQGRQVGSEKSHGVSSSLGLPKSLKAARQLLDEQHHGLHKVKDRVVEYLAVMRLKGSSTRAPILCFIGPPGVGKTSLARSVAEVLGRPFVRIALGGVRDESEIRGHRRTYVGAMPGRILNGLRRAQVNDPVMLLDELDKLGKDTLRGDPSAALLEVLDPEQNAHFTDAYLGLSCDLSRVTFVATANNASDIPAPLLDRLEVISISGYTLEEKVHIAQRHLLPKALADHGLGPANVHLPNHVLEHIVERYTREAGVRNLARHLAALCRHVAVSIVSDHEALFTNTSQEYPLLQLPNSTTATTASVSASSMQSHPSKAWFESVMAAPYNSGIHLEGSLADHSSLAGLSEAPLDKLWSNNTSSMHYDHQTGHGHTAISTSTHYPHSMQTVSSSNSNRNGLLAKVLSSKQKHAAGPAVAGGLLATNPGYQLQHTTLTAQSSASNQTTNSPGNTSGIGGRVSRMFSWGGSSSSGHQQAKVRHPATSAVRHPGGVRVVGSQPRVQYHGVPHALPYPPDLLQQHGAITMTQDLVEVVLGPPRFGSPAEPCEAVALPGAAAGLVWTSVGGSVQIIECARVSFGSPDRPGTLTLTGQVGEVLEESARIALSWIRAHAQELGFEPLSSFSRVASGPGRPAYLPQTGVHSDIAQIAKQRASNIARHKSATSSQGSVRETAEFSSRQTLNALSGNTLRVSEPVSNQTSSEVIDPDNEPILVSSNIIEQAISPALCWDIHVHLPAGAIPKDGPSAGITLATALLSLLSSRVVRADTAMTGELTLRGLVLPVGGIKEKLLAARQAGMSRVIVPARNMADVIADVPAAVRSTLTIIPVERIEQVLAAAFDPPFVMQPPPQLPSRL